MGTIKFLSGLAFFAVFAIAIVSYSIGYASDNDAAISISEDPQLNSMGSEMKSDLSNLKESSDTSFNILIESNIKSGDDTVEGGGQFKAGPSNVLSASGNLLNSTTDVLLGGKGSQFSFIPTTILAFLTLIAGLYAWKAWKGNPD